MVRYRTMTPEEYKENSNKFKINYGIQSTPFGTCLIGITNTDKAILYLGFVDKGTKESLLDLQNTWNFSELIEDNENETEEIVQKIFNQRVFNDDSIVVVLKGTEFQIKVWEALLKIPDGTLTTYKQIAKNIGKPTAIRAVGNAVMKNNIAYLVPCHRVVGKSSSDKYKWGINRKEHIYMHERKLLNT